MGLSSEMDIDLVHRYSHLGENLLRTTYNNLGVKLTGTIEVCDGCAQPKTKSNAVGENNYTRDSQLGERISVDKNGTFLERLIGNRYWIGVVDNYSRYYWSFFM